VGFDLSGTPGRSIGNGQPIHREQSDDIPGTAAKPRLVHIRRLSGTFAAPNYI